MLRPKNIKYNKAQKGRIKGNETRACQINFGSFGIKALEPGRLTAHQIEAARRTIMRKIKKNGRLWVNVFPNTPVTKKPNEVRMGKGKGNVELWVCKIKPGKVLFEIDKISSKIAHDVFKTACSKLPFKTKIIIKM